MSSVTSYDRINAALEDAGRFGRRYGAWTLYNCTAHEDSDPSLGVVYNPAKQRSVVRCFTGCEDRDVLAAIGLGVADLYDDARRRTSRRDVPLRVTPTPRPVARAPREDPLAAQTGPPRIAARYYYRLPDGTAAGRVTRAYIPHERGTKRVFWQNRWDGNTWARGGFPALVYRLPEVISAVREGRTVYVVEGEKDADNAARAGLTATCNAMGAGKFRAAHADQLAGARRVVVVADRDEHEAGLRHAAAVAELLRGRVGSVEIVGAAVGKDISDHLAAGLGPDELVPLDPPTPLVQGWAQVRLDNATLWHGSATTGIRQIDRAEEDTVGTGVYLAEQDIAAGYARHRAARARTGTPVLYAVSVREARLVDLTDQRTLDQVLTGFGPVLTAEQHRAERAENPSWLRITNLRDLRDTLDRNGVRVGALKRITQRCGELFSGYLRAQGYAGLLTVEGGEADIGDHLTYLIFDPADLTVTAGNHLPIPAHAPARKDQLTMPDVPDPVTVYTKPDCPQCAATKRTLDRLGVGYTEVDVSTDADARRQLLAMGYTTAPVVAAGDSHFAGYRPDRLAALGRARAEGRHSPAPQQPEPGWRMDNGVITSAPLDQPADTWRMDNGIIVAADTAQRQPATSAQPPPRAARPASPAARPTHTRRR